MSIYVLFGYIVSDIGYIVTVIGAVKNFNGYIVTITDAEKNCSPCFVSLHAVALLVSFTIKEQNKIKNFKYKVACKTGTDCRLIHRRVNILPFLCIRTSSPLKRFKVYNGVYCKSYPCSLVKR